MTNIAFVDGIRYAVKDVREGAMGKVWLATHPVIGKRVALKVIHPELSTNEEMPS